MSSHENLSPQIVQRVAKEIRTLCTKPPEGIVYVPTEEETMSEIHVEIKGPEETPYDGGYFRMKLILTEGFPQSPPKAYFLTKIFHPNISNIGDICVNTLKRDWNPDLGIIHVLQVIRCLLIVPFPESSLNDEAGRLFMDSYEEYAHRARIFTSIHAPKISITAPNKEDINKEQTPENESIGSSGDKPSLLVKKSSGISKELSISDRQKAAAKKKSLKRL